MALQWLPAAAGVIGGLLNYLGGKKQQEAQLSAAETAAAQSAAATQAQLEYQREADALAKALYEKNLATQQNMFEQSLAEQRRQADLANILALRQAGIGLGTGLLSTQLGQDLALGLASQQKKEQLPLQLAQLSGLQALPYLQALLGLPSYSIPATIPFNDPLSLRKNVVQNLAEIIPTANAIAQGQSLPSITTSKEQLGEVPLANIALSPTKVDLSSILQQSPLYQYQQKIGEDAIKRSLAARGLLGSSEQTARIADLAQRLSAQEMQNRIAQLAGLLDFARGLPISQGYANTAQNALNPLGDLKSLSNSLNSMIQTANQGGINPNTYLGFAQGIGNTLAGMNQALGQGLQQRANIVGTGGQNLANISLGMGNIAQPNLASAWNTAWNTFTNLSPYFQYSNYSVPKVSNERSNYLSYLNPSTYTNALNRFGNSFYSLFGG